MRKFIAKSIAFAGCLLLLASGPLLAQSKGANLPIDVSADSSVVDMNSKSLTYSGNVVVKRGDVRLRANSVRVNAAAGGKPDKIFANGNVVVDSPNGTVSGDSGVYDVTPNLITLTGNVVLTKGKNKQTANVLTVNLTTGIAKFGGTAPANPGQPAQPGTRVHGQFSQPPQSKPAATP